MSRRSGFGSSRRTELVANFLVEVYASRSASRADLEAAARSAAPKGSPVRYIESILVPEDETCFHLFEAPSAEIVNEAATRAALLVQRVVRTAD